MQRIAVLLSGPVSNDSRVIRIVNSLIKVAVVDLFYISGTERDRALFGPRVQLYTTEPIMSWYSKILQNSLFIYEYRFLERIILNTGFKYDFIYANDLPTLKPAINIKRQIGGKVIYDSHEIFVGTLNQFFPDTGSVLIKCRNWIALQIMTLSGKIAEKGMLKSVDHFITTNHSFKLYFERKFGFKPIRVVMNCPITNQSNERRNIRELLGLSNRDFIALFQGVMNKGRALDILIEAFKHVRPNIKLVMIGGGVLKNDLQNYVKSNNLSQSIYFIDMVPAADLMCYTRDADIGINLQQDLNISKKLASANKLFEYIHAGIPIIGSNVPENVKIIQGHKVGFIVENNPTEIADLLNSIVELDLSELRRNCHTAAQIYNWENQEIELLGIFSQTKSA